MMNPLIEAYVNHVGRIRVVHSLPGRLRVNVGGVKQFPEAAAKFADLFRARLLKLPGVASADLCLVTGNLLLRYDPEKTCEAEIRAWLETSWQAFLQFLRGLGDVDGPDAPGVAAAVARFVATL